jgi:hypothetical protein
MSYKQIFNYCLETKLILIIVSPAFNAVNFYISITVLTLLSQYKHTESLYTGFNDILALPSVVPTLQPLKSLGQNLNIA